MYRDERGQRGARAGMEVLVVGANLCVRLYKSGGNWYLYDFSNPDSPTHTLILNNIYRPNFRVVGMKVESSDDAAAYVKYDLGNDGMKVAYDKYAANVIHPLFVTQVWLDSATTATAVTLYG